jgi:hypothetical protein
MQGEELFGAATGIDSGNFDMFTRALSSETTEPRSSPGTPPEPSASSEAGLGSLTLSSEIGHYNLSSSEAAGDIAWTRVASSTFDMFARVLSSEMTEPGDRSPPGTPPEPSTSLSLLTPLEHRSPQTPGQELMGVRIFCCYGCEYSCHVVGGDARDNSQVFG